MKQVFNGGIELGILQIVGDENLSPQDLERKAYLESLPKNKWVTLNDDGRMISDDEAAEIEAEELNRFSIIK